MKAMVYHGPGNVELTDIPKPTAGYGQVLVEIKYCGICGTDVHAYKSSGIFDWELVPGHEAVGFVAEVGEGVAGFSVGDRVAVGPPGDCSDCYACNTGHPNTCPNAFLNTLGIGPNTQGAFAQFVLAPNGLEHCRLFNEGRANHLDELGEIHEEFFKHRAEVMEAMGKYKAYQPRRMFKD